MTFEQVLVFHRIVQSGSFKAASDLMHKTQPAISLAIKKLEDEMEVALFDRSGYRPVLTEHGKVFYERSQRLLSGMQDLEGLSKSFQKGEEPEVAVAVDGISPLPKILKLFKQFGERYPHTKLNLGFDILSEAERRVLDREAQIGITHFITDKQSLEIIPITFVKMIPVISRELFLEKKVMGQRDLLDIEQVVVSDKNKGKISFGLLESGKKWNVSDSNFKREIIVAGLGWGHLPEHSIEQEIKEGKLVALNFEDIHPRELEINLIRLKKNVLGPVAKCLWEELESLHKHQ